MREDTPRIQEMMRVYDPDGEWVGLVSAVGPTHFEVTGGPLHAMRVYDVPMRDVREVRSRDRVILWFHPGPGQEIEDDAGTAVPPAEGHASEGG
ncbi:MAG TPA: hypothetical protein VK013_08095 [Myxococcaceae bacterium]|nr:hypothetical protein [Myxococcaceae bacterium]